MASAAAFTEGAAFVAGGYGRGEKAQQKLGPRYCIGFPEEASFGRCFPVWNVSPWARRGPKLRSQPVHQTLSYGLMQWLRMRREGGGDCRACPPREQPMLCLRDLEACELRPPQLIVLHGVCDSL